MSSAMIRTMLGSLAVSAPRTFVCGASERIAANRRRGAIRRWCIVDISSCARVVSMRGGGAAAYTNFVFPGIATDGSGTLPHSYFSGPSRSLLLSSLSQVISWPVYVHIRPMIAMSVLLHMYLALLIGLPSRMLLIIALCSLTYMLCRPPGPLN